ncbi:MAG: glycosyltransferase [Christensenellales bacterium]|jgi:glycosyltransferase involved in cell wall biosynthesis
MISISLCMIVKNEEATLGRCLDSVSGIADEIIIVDTGSTDHTLSIARQYTDFVYNFEWIDDFSAARNFSFSKATQDYILWLDADDVIPPEEAEKFKQLKSTLSPDVDIVMMRYIIAFDAQGRGTYSYYRERLSKRSRNYRWCEPVHECLTLFGNILHADISIHHKKIRPTPSGRNLAIYEGILEKNGILTPRGQYYFARELKDNGQFARAAEFFTQFLSSRLGWREDNINACSELARCYNRLSRPKDALRALVRSFEYDLPRPEVCCQIGYHYKQATDYEKAVFWFDLALRVNVPEDSWGFQQPDYWGYIPSIELAFCYSKLGNLGKAIAYNEKAAGYKPEAQSVQINRTYFASLQADN